jgi:hypothetical protein
LGNQMDEGAVHLTFNACTLRLLPEERQV